MSSAEPAAAVRDATSVTIPELLLRAQSSRCAIRFVDHELNERPLGYDELFAGARRVAAGLRERGVGPGDRVCLLSSTSPETVIALCGVWWARAVPVVLSLPRRVSEIDEYLQEVRRRLAQADSDVLLVADAFAPLLAGNPLGVQGLALGEVGIDGGEERAEEWDSSDVALLQFTSGTTALSRAVCLSHRQILANILAFSRTLDVHPDVDSGVSWLPLYHDMGMIALLTAIAHGANLVIEPPEEFLARPGSWLDAMSRYGSSVTVAPNMAFALAARDLQLRPRKLDLSCIRVAGNGAEPIDVELLGNFLDEAARYGFDRTALCPMYGLAEATLAVTVSRPGEPMRELAVSRSALERERRAVPAAPGSPDVRRLVACGAPLSGVDVRILDPGGSEVAEGEVGEIVVSSPSLMSGYWRDPEATARVLRDGWLHTGDLGFFSDGELVVCGRIKDMIVVGGRNLYPEDYEQRASAIDGMRRGNIVAFGLAEEERMIVVAETRLTGAEAERLATEAVRKLTLELSHAPEEVILLPPGTLPKTSSGKLQRGACRERYLAGRLEPVASARRR